MLIAFTCIIHTVEATSPGEEILNNEELLRTHIESMQSSVTPFYNAEVKRRLSYMLNSKASYTEAMLGRMIQYYPYIDSIFQANGLPADLKYITVIESSLKADIHSHAGAAGLWQFMRATGQNFGLRVNWSVDERLDPFLSTEAAAEYLKLLYKMYDDWTLVLMAYNCGPGRLNKAIKLAGDSSYHKVVNYLPRETRDYIPKFLAASFFMKNYGMFGYNPEWPHFDKQLVRRIKVYDKITLKEISDFSGFDMEMLKELNPSIRRNYVPHSERGYYLTVPLRYIDTIKEFISTYGLPPLEVDEDIEYVSSDKIIDSTSLERARYLRLEYTVKSGDSWEEIADLFEVNPYLIKYWNNSHPLLSPRQKVVLYLPNTRRNRSYRAILAKNKCELLPKNSGFVELDSKTNVNDYTAVVVNADGKKVNLPALVQELSAEKFY